MKKKPHKQNVEAYIYIPLFLIFIYNLVYIFFHSLFIFPAVFFHPSLFWLTAAILFVITIVQRRNTVYIISLCVYATNGGTCSRPTTRMHTYRSRTMIIKTAPLVYPICQLNQATIKYRYASVTNIFKAHHSPPKSPVIKNGIKFQLNRVRRLRCLACSPMPICVR